MRKLAAAAMLVALVIPVTGRDVHAHLGNISYADLEARGKVVLLRLKYAAHITPGAPAEGTSPVTRQQVLALEKPIHDWLSETTKLVAAGKPCPLSIDNIVGPDANDDLEVHAFWECESDVKGFRLDMHPLSRVLSEWQTIASLRMGGESYSTVLSQGATRWTVGDVPAGLGGNEVAAEGGDAEVEEGSAFSRFFVLGVEHIWTGYDHLLFLLAVLLAGGGIARLAGIVTSFTVAHSVTLGAAATGLVQLPVAPVEAAIALSIVYVAVENLLGRGADRRMFVTFAFGLIHGFGFASMLADAGLPASGVLVPLLAFNLGVEAGQLAVVVVVVPILSVVLRGPHARTVRNALSVLIAIAGAVWAVERVGAIVS